MNTIQSRLCLTCDKPVKGRTDKKYCDDYCRNNYNNQLKAGSHKLVRNINTALIKNRRILESIINEGEEIAQATKDQLLQKGFYFKYMTHTYINRKGTTYFYCYDYGYLPLEADWYLVLKEKNNG